MNQGKLVMLLARKEKFRHQNVCVALILGFFLFDSFIMGCSRQTRHGVLSFFFDGVPPLESPKHSTSGDSLEAVNLLAPNASDSSVSVAPTGSSHPSLDESACTTCHDARQSFNLIDAPGNLCKTCHDKADGKFVHAPVEGADCGMCHNPHGSEYPSLLLMNGRPLCLQCHDEAEIKALEVHGDIGEMLCTNCHNPHSSDTEHLMK